MAYSKTVRFAPTVTTGTTTVTANEFPYYSLVDYDKARNNYKKIVEEQQYQRIKSYYDKLENIVPYPSIEVDDYSDIEEI